MTEAIFYTSNNDELCRCELEENQEIVTQRKKDFEEYLDKKVENGELSQQVAKNYISQTPYFFNDLCNENLISCVKQNFQNLLFEISDIECLTQIYQAMNVDFSKCDEIYYKYNRERRSGNPSACFRIYIDFLKKRKQKQLISAEEFEIFLKNLYKNFRETLPEKKSFLELQENTSLFETTQGEKCNFFITNDGISIVAIFKDRELIFDEKEFDCYLVNSANSEKEKQKYPKYSSLVFDLILHKNNLIFDDSQYWYVTSVKSNLEAESVIQEARFDQWRPRIDEMRNGKIVFIYVNDPIKAFYALGKLDNTDKELFDIADIAMLKTPIKLGELDPITKKVQNYGKLRNRKLLNYLLYRLSMIDLSINESGTTSAETKQKK